MKEKYSLFFIVKGRLDMCVKQVNKHVTPNDIADREKQCTVLISATMQSDPPDLGLRLCLSDVSFSRDISNQQHIKIQSYCNTSLIFFFSSQS